MHLRKILASQYFAYAVFISFFIGLTVALVIKSPDYATTETVTSDKSTISSVENVKTVIQELIDYEYYSDQITTHYFQNIRNHIGNFSSFGSRVTGYPGYELSIDYITDFFQSQNLTEVQTLSYPHLVPLDRGTRFTLGGKNYSAHALAPNSVHTSKIPSGGLSGMLVYGGSGKYSDLDGKKIDGAIVVLEFNSQHNWINVASLGAKGVIYLTPDKTNRYEAETKSIDIPLEFPRIYIDNKTLSGTMRTLSTQVNQTVTIYSDIEWERIDAKNVMGILPGLDDDIIVLSAYFDSSSCVPALSPGADEACGIATLLELIRIMKDNKVVPKKTLMFLALSGHNQAAAGAREFVSSNYDRLNRQGGIKLFLSLDLSSSTKIIGLNPYGYLYKFKLRYTTGNNLFYRLKSIGDIFLQYASEIRMTTDHSFSVDSYVNIQDIFEDIAPFTFVGDQEPFIASNVLGLSLFSAQSPRNLYNTPFDLPSYLQFNQLEAQVIYSICALVQLVNDTDLDNYLDLQPKGFSVKPNMHVGFGVITGSCKIYNESSLWTDNVANALIRITSRDPNTNSPGVYSYYTQTDEEGGFTVNGVSSSQPDNPLEFDVEAYTFNSEGKLVQANNLGPFRVFFDQSNKLVTQKITINPTVFNCGTLGLFDISHPYSRYISSQSLTYQVLNPESRASLQYYGYKNLDSVSLVFLPPHTRSSIIGTFPNNVLGIYATNSSADLLRGYGFQVEKGEFKNLGISTFITSKDLQSKTQTFISWYTSHNIYDQRVNETFQELSLQIEIINSLLQNYDYSEALQEMNQARLMSFTALRQARNIITDGSNTALLFAFFLIPFSLTLSNFLFDLNSEKRWLIVSCIIYFVAFGFFYLIHPGFKIAPQLGLTLIGFINVISVLIIFYMLFHESTGFLVQIRKNTLGAHFIKSNQTSVVLIAIKTGIQRMKKHKPRTILNLSAVALLSFSLTLLTSTSSQTGFNFLELALPVAIAILLMSNTSISTVYDSKKEISIFTSLGVSPSSILGLFIAEFLLHAIIGSMVGYSGGIIVIRFLSSIDLISESFSVNYSSRAVIITLIFSGLGMLVGLVLPLRESSLNSLPSQKRSWEISTLPEGDGSQWNISLPFVASSEDEVEGILAFLNEFLLIFESENVGGPFFVSSPIIFKNQPGIEKHLTTTVYLAPFDMGIIQTVDVYSYLDTVKNHWKFVIKLNRVEGVLQAWQALVKRYIGIMRQQFLLWKGLSREDKMASTEQFKNLIFSLSPDT
ncbi:hypothetical protein CEE45_14935 [Candidatus Heimdallarchaeota archaeon B3_Heim]|nr:MAG: hypothetical protein CEE45_14935 [Candidatus Heimdallarchaeota archaeon B3_Heim]